MPLLVVLMAAVRMATAHGNGLYAIYLSSIHNLEPDVADGEDPCAFVAIPDYSVSLHIGGLFAILGTAFLGTMLPLIVNRYMKNVSPVLLACGKLLGAGVILATGFIHMFPAANQVTPIPTLREHHFYIVT